MMSIRKALEELLLIVEIHQKCTKNNFAWAEIEYAKELLAQPEQEGKTTYIGETQWMQVPEPLSDGEIYEIFSKNPCTKFIELTRLIEKAHGIGDKK
jgi:hypothetical protein